MPSMRDFSPPNYALFQNDGLPFWTGTLSQSDCNCHDRTASELLTDHHWDGIFRVHINPGVLEASTDDAMTCDWKPGTGSGIVYSPIAVATDATFRTTTSLVRGGANQWAINIYCDDDSNPGEDLLLWRGLQRKSPSTIGLSGPAGWYDYDSGCDTTVTEMELRRKPRDDCPCGPVFDGTCDLDTGVDLQLTNANGDFNTDDWHCYALTGPSSLCNGFTHCYCSPPSFQSAYSIPDALWDGVLHQDLSGSSPNNCTWSSRKLGFGTASAVERGPLLPDMSTVSNGCVDCTDICSQEGVTGRYTVDGHVAILPQAIWASSYYGKVDTWSVWWGEHATDDLKHHVWFREYSQSPEGYYETADRDWWELIVGSVHMDCKNAIYAPCGLDVIGVQTIDAQ